MGETNHWQLIKLDEFEYPSAPTRTRIDQMLHRVRSLFNSTKASSTDEKSGDYPHYREFDLAPAVQVFSENWQEWRQTEEDGVRIVISPPFSGTANIVRAWAEQEDLQVLQPPTLEQIKAVAVEAWWQSQQQSEWVIDDLSRYWLRTTTGLHFLRTFLPKLIRGELGKGTLVCDSWSYSFIQRAWPVPIPSVYCFKAATPDLLRQVGIASDDGSLAGLTARARGNVGLALAIWAVTQSSDKELPNLPKSVNDYTAFILHSLLLHHGLDRTTLATALPMIAEDQLEVQLLQLEHAGLVECQDNHWMVTVHGYLPVRDFLSNRGFWLDTL